ncbi:MAG: alkaline phosphatase family protein [Rhodococcus sp. (in: high G+C Gram-positive bacteria)]
MLLSPRYGSESLADVVPSVLSCIGLDGETDRLGLRLEGTRRVCVLMIDGLGADQLAEHPEDAPFLTRHLRSVITAGFPSTTATSLSSLGTGVPPGQHGIVGYQVALPGQDLLMNTLQWKLHGSASDSEPLPELTPETFQPSPTAFERAATAGIAVTHVGPSMQNGSGLTRASLRGGVFRASVSPGDLAAEAVSALAEAGPALVYAYHGDLDLVGHVRGPRSLAWRLQLRHVDLLAESIAAQLPGDGALVVVADHGMVQVGNRVDYDSIADLREGVRLLGGEPRMRYLYTRAGAVDDVQRAWQNTLGNRFTVVTRDDAVARGWFGPTVSSDAYSRIGDLLALANDTSAVVRSQAETTASMLRGHHGSLTSAELSVPLVVARP